MKTSQAGLDLIKRWEGCRLKSYQDSVGVWTIGYGLTTAAGIVPVTAGMTITQRQADAYLEQALVKYETAVERALKRKPTQAQFDAMVSLCYNIGPGAFAGSSVVRRFNEGNIAGAADAFLMWTKAGGRELQGLVNRRKDERKLFLTASTIASDVPPPPDVEPPTDAPPATGNSAAAVIIGGILAAIAAAMAYIFGGK